jgi:bifunctional DNase/RNase
MDIHRKRRAEHKVDKAVSWTVEAMIDLFETVEKTVSKGVIHSEKQSSYSADKKE